MGAVFVVSTSSVQSQSMYSAPVATTSGVASVRAQAVPMRAPVHVSSSAPSSVDPLYYSSGASVDGQLSLPQIANGPTAGVMALTMSAFLAIAGFAVKAMAFFNRQARGEYCDLESGDIAMATAASIRHNKSLPTYGKDKIADKTTGRVCALLGKRDNRQAAVVTFSHRVIKKVQGVNLQWKRMYWAEQDCYVRMRLSTKGIKTINKHGLQAAAAKFGVNLHKYKNGTSGRGYNKHLTKEGAASLEGRGNPASKQIAYRTVMGEKSDRMTGLPIAMMISHGKKMPKLSLPADQRKALLRALTTELIRHGRIKTTLIRGKAMRKHVDHMITLAKDGSLHARRQAMGYIYDKQLVHALFEQVPERYADRNGGYTRIVRTMPRRGDCAKMCFIELI